MTMSDMEIKVYLEEANVNKKFFTSNSKENNLKCPFCQQELEINDLDVQLLGCENQNCKHSIHYDTVGTKELWQELIRTRKALDVAVDKLKGIKAYYDDSYADPHFVNWHIVAQRLANDADDAIKAITAEQKDK